MWAILRALLDLASEALCGERLLGRDRLTVNVKGVDPHQLLSSKGEQLKAFCDGSVLQDGRCGIAVFYTDGHPYNFHGGFAPSPPASSNLVELVALLWALLRHPRGQHLTVFSDSAHALRVVERLSTRAPPPRRPLEPREAAVARVVHWLLRLRTAQTCFFKVAAHKRYTHNEAADALARRGAAAAPSLAPPLRAGWPRVLLLLLRYILQQAPRDGGTRRPAARGAPPRGVRRPRPTGESKEVSRVLALDCEMVGVGPLGLESRLASVAVVNACGQQVYFSYARPAKNVTDYRTRWSGITPQLLQGAPDVAKVQKEVAALLEGHIVVGHGLENDFKCLGYFHPRALVRDTAHDLPRLLTHRGRPKKLRKIAWEFLGLTIQDGEHDPLEDARAALQLYLRFEKEFEARKAKSLMTDTAGSEDKLLEAASHDSKKCS
ncbi:hypothetical protein AB1Y20_018360 [Prymnesium parvum]|uniref:RNA exonuclease 4 n=1 Tax=Prymnesium parvum TaxID=97485 RepID=A0AB34JRP4_PRYPA